MSETIPTQIRLACGCDVPYEIGQPIYNYYDNRAGEITGLATHSDPDTYGTDMKGMSFPDGKAWWTVTSAGFVDGSRMCCQACAVSKGWLDAAQQFPTTSNNKENNMNNNPQLTAQIKELEDRIDNDAAQITALDKAREDYRKLYNTSVEDVRDNVKRIEKVLHSHAKDCDDQTVIDILIEQINEATRNGFPELRKCNRNYELTITYTLEVEAANEQDARDKFDDGDYDHLIELSDYYELDVEEGY